MNTKRQLQMAVYVLQRALVNVTRHADRGATDPIVDTTQELLALIDDLPQAVMDAEYQHCTTCHHYQVCTDQEPYGDRHVARTTYECNAKDFDDCPVVRLCGLSSQPGPYQVPSFLQKQAG